MSSFAFWALFVVAAALTVALVRKSRRFSETIHRLEAREHALEQEVAAVQGQVAQAEADQQLQSRFMKELPHVLHELHAAAGAREIPALLLKATTRLLEPRRVLVAVRRRAVEVDQDRHMRLVVAAAFPTNWIAIGGEIRIGQGEIGYAAEVQRVMDRHDIENLQAPLRKRLRDETPACQPDVVAPMLFREELMGIVAVEGGKRTTKDAVRLLAQAGGVALHAHARYVEMKATASIDSLTGIFNKRYLTFRLSDELRQALELGRSLSLFIFDLDHFKVYNDRNGHVAGDWLLRELAKLVRAHLRKDAVFGRYGGEEFLILFPGSRREQALGAAENIRRVIANHKFALGADQPLGVVTISGGVAEGPVDGADASRLLRAADEALYKAKEAGRNRVLAFEPVELGGPALDPSEGHTPQPGVLLSLASITPARGIPSLTREPRAEVLAAALARDGRRKRSDDEGSGES